VRISDLLGRPVVDADGVAVGDVHDVRLVQDGPLLEGASAALRLDGLLIGGGAVSVRLGYHRNRVRGPALLRGPLTALERRARFAGWPEVVVEDDGPLRLRCRAADLRPLDDRA
jgi:hypothetical protein